MCMWIAGGDFYYTNPTGQMYNPVTKTLTDPVAMAIFQDPNNNLNLYPFTALLPNGYVIVIAGRITRFYA